MEILKKYNQLDSAILVSSGLYFILATVEKVGDNNYYNSNKYLDWVFRPAYYPECLTSAKIFLLSDLNFDFDELNGIILFRITGYSDSFVLILN